MNQLGLPLREWSGAQQTDHLNPRQGRLAALVGLIGLGALEGLVQGVGGEDPEDHRHAGSDLHLLDARGALPGHEVVVTGDPPHNGTEAEDHVHPAGRGESPSDQRQLESTRCPGHRHVTLIGSDLTQGIERPVEQAYRDPAIELGAPAMPAQIPRPLCSPTQRRPNPRRHLIERPLGQGEEIRAGH